MKRLAAFFSLMLLISCNKNYDYVGMFYSLGESADERFEMSMAYNDTHGYDKIHVDSDDYSLYVMTDVHVDFSTVNLDRYVSDYLNDSLAPPFSLCHGPFRLFLRTRAPRHRCWQEDLLLRRKSRCLFQTMERMPLSYQDLNILVRGGDAKRLP